MPHILDSLGEEDEPQDLMPPVPVRSRIPSINPATALPIALPGSPARGTAAVAVGSTSSLTRTNTAPSPHRPSTSTNAESSEAVSADRDLGGTLTMAGFGAGVDSSNTGIGDGKPSGTTPPVMQRRKTIKIEDDETKGVDSKNINAAAMAAAVASVAALGGRQPARFGVDSATAAMVNTQGRRPSYMGILSSNSNSGTAVSAAQPRRPSLRMGTSSGDSSAAPSGPNTAARKNSLMTLTAAFNEALPQSDFASSSTSNPVVAALKMSNRPSRRASMTLSSFDDIDENSLMHHGGGVHRGAGYAGALSAAAAAAAAATAAAMAAAGGDSSTTAVPAASTSTNMGPSFTAVVPDIVDNANAAAPVLNPKQKTGPNWDAVEYARMLVRNPNANTRAMIGAYDPYPPVWPGAWDVMKRRRELGRPLKDEWQRESTKRFEPVKESSKLGPGSYPLANAAAGPSNLGQVVFKSKVSRLMRRVDGTGQGDHVGPGSYSVDMVEVESGFTPWVQSVSKKLGRAVTGVKKMPFGTDAKILSMLSEKPDISFYAGQTDNKKANPGPSETNIRHSKSSQMHHFSKCFLVGQVPLKTDKY